MEIKEIELKLMETLNDSDNEIVKKQYIEAISDYLKNNKSCTEILSIVVRGIDIDRASNYYDYLEGVSKNDIQIIWKQVKDNKEITKNTNNNGIKFLSGLLSLSFLKVSYLELLASNIIIKLVNMSQDDKFNFTHEDYISAFNDYFVEEMLTLQKYPEWEDLNTSGEITKKFAEDIIYSLSKNQEDEHTAIKKWAIYGIRVAEKRIEQEKIESKIPESKISTLSEVIEHYKFVEKHLRDIVYENAKIEKLNEVLKDDISKLNIDKKNLEEEINTLNSNIDGCQKRINELEKEIEEHKKINSAAASLKKNDEEALLKNIANDLKAEYLDFVDSKDDEMDIQLGEIYREKLNNIFNLLKNKGIRME